MLSTKRNQPLLLLFVLLLLPSLTAPALPAAGGKKRAMVRVAVTDEAPGRTVVTISLPSFGRRIVTIGGKKYLRPFLEGEGRFLERGVPDLPRIRRSIVIPGKTPPKVEILKRKQEKIEKVLVAPSRGNLKRNVDPRAVPYSFGPSFGRDAWFPRGTVAVERTFVIHGVRGAVLTVNPFQYNPARRILRVTREITVALTAKELEGKGRPSPAAGCADPAFAALLERSLLNYRGAAAGPTPPERGGMLIITADRFNGAVQPLAKWKRSIGIPTEVVNVSAVGNDSGAIKDFIRTTYERGGLSYVLLVGDAKEVAAPMAHGGAADPTYALLDGDDHYPDVFVGRFPADTLSQVRTQVARTIAYEKGDHGGPRFLEGTGIASDQGPGHLGEYDFEHMDLIRDDLLACGFTAVDRIYDPGATAAQVTAALNAGRRIVDYAGHGTRTSWSTTGFSAGDVAELANCGMLPIVVSVGCLNGRFEEGTCFAEAWMQARHEGRPAGAVAVWASSVTMSWSPPMTAQDAFIDLFTSKNLESFGALCFAGAIEMMNDYGKAGEDEFDNWIVFGDPSLRAWPGGPPAACDPPALKTDTAALSASRGGTVTFFLDAGPACGGRPFRLLGSLSGSEPGWALPGGGTLPLVFDRLTDFMLSHPRSPLFRGFTGNLDGLGRATVVLDTRGPLHRPSFTGRVLTFAYALGPPWNAPSEAATVRIDP